MNSLVRFLVSAAGTILAAAVVPAQDSVERFDTAYNSITLQRSGDIVELRARYRGNDTLESAVDLSDPLKLVVAYTRSLYGALFIEPNPKRVLMVGLGGAGFHRLFAAAYPDTLLHTVELDPMVHELCRTRMKFTPTAKTPVTIMDGRMFIKRDRERWDWIVLDAFRGDSVPPHLKTEEFYRECAARLTDRGVFVSNLHATTELDYSDLRTIQAVFPQVVLLGVDGRGNVIALAVKYASPSITDPSKWPDPASLQKPVFNGRLDLAQIKGEVMPFPTARVKRARVLTDDFAPVEFLTTVKENNTRNE
jgi:spermidine synthase